MKRVLKGRVVLVTGGAVRVGAAISRRFAKAGARVAIHCHAHVAEAEALAAAIRADGGAADVFAFDLSTLAAPGALARAVEEGVGPVSVLVNSAARFDRASFLDTPPEVLEAQWALNARGPFLLTQALARGMVARGVGDVVNVLDIGGVFQTVPRYSAYAMSKAALAQLTHTLAVELAPAVRVNGVAPGTVMPPEHYSTEIREALRARIPLGRLGSPDDVADTVLFLVTGPRFMTGQIIAVDGGRALAP